MQLPNIYKFEEHFKLLEFNDFHWNNKLYSSKYLHTKIVV